MDLAELCAAIDANTDAAFGGTWGVPEAAVSPPTATRPGRACLQFANCQLLT